MRYKNLRADTSKTGREKWGIEGENSDGTDPEPVGPTDPVAPAPEPEPKQSKGKKNGTKKK